MSLPATDDSRVTCSGPLTSDNAVPTALHPCSRVEVQSTYFCGLLDHGAISFALKEESVFR